VGKCLEQQSTKKELLNFKTMCMSIFRERNCTTKNSFQRWIVAKTAGDEIQKKILLLNVVFVPIIFEAK
jgi:hypothetical protein